MAKKKEDKIVYKGKITIKDQKNGRTVSKRTINNEGQLGMFNNICRFLAGEFYTTNTHTFHNYMNRQLQAIPRQLVVKGEGFVIGVQREIELVGKPVVKDKQVYLTFIIPYILVGDKEIEEYRLTSIGGDTLAIVTDEEPSAIEENQSRLVEWIIKIDNE